MPLQCLPPDVAEAADAAWSPDRSTRYLARVERHLAGLTRQERLSFLESQLRAWRELYAEFICRKTGGCIVSADAPSASDYLLTIVGLQARIEEIKEEFP